MAIIVVATLLVGSCLWVPKEAVPTTWDGDRPRAIPDHPRPPWLQRVRWVRFCWAWESLPDRAWLHPPIPASTRSTVAPAPIRMNTNLGSACSTQVTIQLPELRLLPSLHTTLWPLLIAEQTLLVLALGLAATWAARRRRRASADGSVERIESRAAESATAG